MSRYVFNVLAYSPPARRWLTSLALQYHVHNSTGIKVVVVNGLQIVTAYAHANAGGLDTARRAEAVEVFKVISAAYDTERLSA